MDRGSYRMVVNTRLHGERWTAQVQVVTHGTALAEAQAEDDREAEAIVGAVRAALSQVMGRL